jgi:hypothetical protein
MPPTKNILLALLIACLLASAMLPRTSHAQSGDTTVFLPLISNSYYLNSTQQTVNIPYFNHQDIPASAKFAEMAVFWYGQVTPDDNYTDIRIAYNDSHLFVVASVFDRRIWYNPTSNGTNLENWDAISVYLNTGGNSSQPNNSSYRFVAQFYPSFQDPTKYRTAYSGNGTGWAIQSLSFNTQPTWWGHSPNSNNDDDGWAMIFRIPFSSLGLAGAPSPGSLWRLSVATHDRDNSAGAAGRTFTWPATAQANNPTSWGNLRFGMPTYNPPAASNIQTLMIRQGHNNAQVMDADVGGGSICAENIKPNFFSLWGNLNYAYRDFINVQNQANVSDWPCFSKFFITFPLNSLPPGKVIKSARLVLYQFGGSDPNNARSSFIQVLTVAEPWQEASITWNNAPLAFENVGVSEIPVINGPPWPNLPREWDVSRALNQAYQSGQPLMLSLYSADRPLHTGKYFRSSDFRDDYHRPALIIEYGNP